MEEIFITNQLMNLLGNTTKSEKYQQDKVTITRLVAYCILFILKKNYELIAADLNKEKALDTDPKAIQQIVFTGKTDNTIKIYYVLQQKKFCNYI